MDLQIFYKFVEYPQIFVDIIISYYIFSNISVYSTKYSKSFKHD